MRRLVLSSESIRPVTVFTALLLSAACFSTTRTFAQRAVTAGIDTYLTSSAKDGEDGSYGDETAFEWDGEDGGGFNQGLLWFDIPQVFLDGFVEGTSTATLKMRNVDSGSPGLFHRMTVDWLEEPDGGNLVSFNSIPDGPGITPGVNAQEVSNLNTGDLTSGVDYEFDVTVDVSAWVGGEPNFGWGILPDGNGGNGIASFEDTANTSPTLLLMDLSLPEGDFNEDGTVDLADFQILVSNYRTGTTFAEGDFTFDGVVDLRDFVGFRQTFNATTVGGAAVPEPQGLALAFVAAALVLVTRRRVIRA